MRVTCRCDSAKGPRGSEIRMVARASTRWSLVLGSQVMLLAACGDSDPSGPPPPPPPPPAAIPKTGQAVPELVRMDETIEALLRDHRIPGAAVAVTYQERLVYARGFGYADTVTKRTVQPDDLFRIASISKPITAVAALTLVEDGLLDLTDPAFGFLPDLTAPPGSTEDPRLPGITLEQLLWHAGGWNRDVSGDPVFQNQQIASALGILGPASAGDIIGFMRGRALDFDPGSAYAYSNFGYMVLGRVLERVTGQTYEAFVQGVLAEAGITRMRIGHSRPGERVADEVQYYDLNTASSVFPGGGTVPFPDGGFYLESMDSHGGWIASAVDLVKFLTAVDAGSNRPDIITGASRLQMLEAPPNLWQGSSYHYGMGWLVRPNPGNWWHNGSLPGTASFFGRHASGFTVAALFNARRMLPSSSFENEIDPEIGQALRAVTTWPSHDLFSTFK